MPERWAKRIPYGTCVGLIKPEQMSFARFSTDDTAGKMRGYVGEGRFTDDPLNTFGGAGVVEIPSCRSCCTTSAKTASSIMWPRIFPPSLAALHEAATRYLGWDMYWHDVRLTEPADGDRCRS